MTQDSTAADKKLFLLDAYALIFRAYFAFAKNPRITSGGLDTSAVYGFTSALLDLLSKENPTHIAVCFDLPEPTERHEIFPEYKANRDATPEAIKLAVPFIHRILEAFKIPALGVPGFEADDVIGTLAKKAEKEGFTTYMMTPDKDFGQLVSPNIFMYRPARGGNPPEVWGEAEVCEKFDLDNVQQVIDYLGMMGDAVDNIPGLPGVGAKTASKLLKQYGSLEETLANADEIKGKLGEKIRDNAELGILSKRLARIITEVPIELASETLTRDAWDQDALMDVFEELEFRTLARRLGIERSNEKPTDAAPKATKKVNLTSNDQMSLFGGDDTPSESTVSLSSRNSIANSDHFYQMVETLGEARQLAFLLAEKSSVAFDTETTSLEVLDAEVVGMSFSYAAGKAYYVHVPQERNKAMEWIHAFKPFWESEETEKIGQNIKYDISVLLNYDVQIKGPLFDTMIAHYLIQPDMRHNMDILAETYLNYETISIETLLGKKGKNQKNMRDIAPKEVLNYAAEDADITFQLKGVFEPKLVETGVEKVFKNIEMPLVPVLARMEREGIKIDVHSLRSYSGELGETIIRLEREIIELAGRPFNVGSPRQLGEVLFDDLKLSDKPKKTKTGQYATSEAILEGLRKKHPIIESILNFRELKKLKSTYVDALPELVHKKTGRVHTSFNQTVAATGRLSSTNPNLQNIPIRTQNGRKVRAMFVPADENHVLMAADYSQIELRVIAALAEDEAMISAFKNGEDIHKATAAKVFEVPPEEVSREQRSNAKTVNFGIVYGVSAFGLSQQTDMSRKEAKAAIDGYFRTYPGIKEYMDKQVSIARDKGYVETITGRRRYLKDIESRNAVVRGHSERNAVNAPIQGSAADIIKLAMIELDRSMRHAKMKSKMLLQVHDELVFDARLDELDALKAMVIEKMEAAVALSVPMVAEVGTGNNWLEAH
ncbi:MAG: DNA polymerase I [Bacteroidetes bacterium]|nr:MAG: DNA polymerase I [Bacteroidota bacterium]